MLIFDHALKTLFFFKLCYCLKLTLILAGCSNYAFIIKEIYYIIHFDDLFPSSEVERRHLNLDTFYEGIRFTCMGTTPS